MELTLIDKKVIEYIKDHECADVEQVHKEFEPLVNDINRMAKILSELVYEKKQLKWCENGGYKIRPNIKI